MVFVSRPQTAQHPRENARHGNVNRAGPWVFCIECGEVLRKTQCRRGACKHRCLYLVKKQQAVFRPCECATCGKRVFIFNPKGLREYCSSECRDKRATHSYACTVCGVKSSRTQCSDACRAVAAAGQCESCGSEIIKYRTKRRFCADCATARKNRADNVRGRLRRMKTKTVRVTMTPREIWERDGGRCGICRKKIDIQIKWPDRRALAIDHIVPLSKGGEDTPENLQATHAACNGRKNNKGGGQRRLFG